MEQQSLRELLEADPIIAAIKDEQDLAAVLRSQCRIVFILYGNLCSIGQIVRTLHGAGKLTFVHADLLDGASSRDVVVDFLHEATGTDGIISTKSSLLKAAHAHGMYTVHRFFLIDSLSRSTLVRQAAACGADCVEILPGYGPKGIQWVLQDMAAAHLDKPLIASGLVSCKEDVTNALSAGASAVSSSSRRVWDELL